MPHGMWYLPEPGIKPGPSALGAWSLDHQESPSHRVLKIFKLLRKTLVIFTFTKIVICKLKDILS